RRGVRLRLRRRVRAGAVVGPGGNPRVEARTRSVLRSPSQGRRRDLCPTIDRVGLRRQGARSLPAGAFASGTVGSAVVVAGRRNRRADPPPAAATEHARRSVFEGNPVAISNRETDRSCRSSTRDTNTGKADYRATPGGGWPLRSRASACRS